MMLHHCQHLLHKHGVASSVLRTSFHTSSFCNKNIRAGVKKITRYQSLRLTYEQANPPETIGVKKAWTSWNTSGLYGETDRRAETTIEDMIIRKFIAGTWVQNVGLFKSPVIIKRRQNIITISGILIISHPDKKEIYFLKGYTEEFLSSYLKRPVRVELQTVQESDALIVKKI